MTDHISLAAQLVLRRPWDDDPELDAVMQNAALLLRRLGDENAGLRHNLAKAAEEIPCAGPVDHRIRVFKREMQAEIDRLRAALEKWMREHRALAAIGADCQGDTSACPCLYCETWRVLS